MKILFTMTLSLLLTTTTALAGEAVSTRLQDYQSRGAGPFNAESGGRLWEKTFPQADGSVRSCTTCHSSNLKQAGKHARTGKAIQPMSPAVNAGRLTDGKKIEKWFRRNCKWTWGRECTPQEKGDLMRFILQQ